MAPSSFPIPSRVIPDVAELEAHRAALTGHCYRMLGCVSEADDAVQETLVRAWKHLPNFEGLASVRTWLHSIATRVCLDALESRQRRGQPMDFRGAGRPDGDLDAMPESVWVDPIAESAVLAPGSSPAEQLMLRQSIRLAFVAALQHLPPKGRAVLLLTEVLGWSAAEIAEHLETTVAGVNSALQRARATLESHNVRLDTAAEQNHALEDAASEDMLRRYMAAFEQYDLTALSALLHEDATLSMPPFALWMKGKADIRTFMGTRGIHCKGSKLVRVHASGQPAFAQYRPGEPGQPHKAWALVVLDIRGGVVHGVQSFLETAKHFPRFGLPLTYSND